ncbi:hypothetical protein [Aurantivibrio plasticivorans]
MKGMFANFSAETWVALMAIIVSIFSLAVALFSLWHQRMHDLLMAEPYVVWCFGRDNNGFVEISLENAGPGAARFIRSELFAGGQKVENWNWQKAFDLIGQEELSKPEVIDAHVTMPKTIFPGQKATLMKIKFTKFGPDELLVRLSKNLDIKYFYRSNLSKDELVTDWLRWP